MQNEAAMKNALGEILTGLYITGFIYLRRIPPYRSLDHIEIFPFYIGFWD